jgi:hypothetical protein
LDMVGDHFSKQDVAPQAEGGTRTIQNISPGT